MKPDPYRLIRSARMTPAPKPVQHGARSGIGNHSRNKEKPCPPCQIWNRIASRTLQAANAGTISKPERIRMLDVITPITTAIADEHPTVSLTEAEQLYDEAMQSHEQSRP